MPKYVYALCALMTVITLALGGMIWGEIAAFGQTSTPTEPDLAGWTERGAGGSITRSRAAESQDPQVNLSRLFVQAQPDFPKPQRTAPAATLSPLPGGSGTPGDVGLKASPARPVPASSARNLPNRTGGFSGSQPTAADSFAAAIPAAGGDVECWTSQAGPSSTSTQTIIRKKTASADATELPSASDDRFVDCNGGSARTFSSYGIQPATDRKSPLDKAGKMPDDSKAAALTRMQPTIDKKKTQIEINPEFEYDNSTELPQLGRYMPASFSTEKVAADILAEEVRTPVLPKIAMPPLAEGNAAMRKDTRQWKISLTPRWRRTEFSCGENKPSSQVNVFSLQPQVTYVHSDLELSATPWLEHDDISGAIDHDSFSRIGMAFSPVYRVFKQENGRPLDFSVGADVFCNYNIPDYSYVDEQVQYGGGLGMDMSRKFFNFAILGAGAGMQRSDRDSGDLPGNFNLYHFDTYLGLQLGQKFVLTPSFTYYDAQKENLPLSSWTDTQVAIAYALSKSMVINGAVGFHTDPLESYYVKTGVGLSF